MDLNRISTFVALLLALSVAAERLVEITKAVIPYLDDSDSRALKELHRRAVLQVMGFIAGIVVVMAAGPAIPKEILETPKDPAAIVALGLLASGGSAFWNSVLSYLERVKRGNSELVDAVKKLKANAANDAAPSGAGASPANVASGQTA